MATNLSPLLTAISWLPWSFQATTWNQHLPNHSKMSIAPIVLGLLWLRLHNPHTTRGNPQSNQSTHWVSWSMTGLQQVTGHLLTTTTTPMTALLTFSPAPLHPRGDSTPFFALKKRQWNSTLKSHSEQRLSVYYLHQQSKDFSSYKTKINPLDPLLITEIPLPLMSTTFELLQDAYVFIKLDLRIVYHLFRLQEDDEWKTPPLANINT